MQRYSFFLIIFLFFVSVSCEKCKRCSYTYEVTTIEQTPNGEEEKTTEVSGVLAKENGETFAEECIKKDEAFTIEQYYQDKKDTTVLNNFDFVCQDI
ncbi:MAG: hypothetical protein WDZ35_07410 [Crocinitomicaceae bacterium]